MGLEVARALHSRGAEVVIGSRDWARYAHVANELGDKGFHPFIADITDPHQVELQLELMHSTKVEPTDIVHAAAGGLEPILRTLARVATRINELRGPEREQATAAAYSELASIVADTHRMAMTVNYSAPSMLLDRLAPSLPAGGSVIFYSSLWSSLYPHPQVPIYYKAVAESKNAMELWLEKQSASWSSRGVAVAIISATWIRDTRVGRFLDRFCAEIMPASDRTRWRSTYVSCAELVEATLEVLGPCGRRVPGGLIRQFLCGPGQVSDHMEADEPLMQVPMAFSMKA